MKGVGEPCAGEPHARFDGRGLETERISVTAPAPDPTNPTSAGAETPEDESAARLTWVLGVEKGRQVWTCDRCSREHLRSIEGKLDSAWW